MSSLRVNPELLRGASDQLEALTSNMAVASSPPATGSSWLATSVAASSAHADAAAVRAVLTERMRATSQKLAAASTAYASTDVRLAGHLSDATRLGTD